MTRLGQVAVIAGAAIVAGACGPEAPATAETIVAMASVDGAEITLAAERGILAAGTPVQLRLTVRNISPRPIAWQATACSLVASMKVVPVAPAGGNAADDGDPGAPGPLDPVKAFVEGVIAVVDAAAATSTLESAGGLLVRGCKIDRGFSTLPSRGAITELATWSALTAAGAPVAPGDYTVVGTFLRIDGDPASAPAAIRAGRGISPVVVQLPLTVVDGGVRAITSREALEILLRDPSFGSSVQAGLVRASDVSLGFDGRDWVARISLPTETVIGTVAGDGLSPAVFTADP